MQFSFTEIIKNFQKGQTGLPICKMFFSDVENMHVKTRFFFRLI